MKNIFKNKMYSNYLPVFILLLVVFIYLMVFYLCDERLIGNHAIRHFLNTIFTFLFSIPLVSSFRKIRSEHIYLKNKSKEIESLDLLTGAYNRKEGLKILEDLSKSVRLSERSASTFFIDILNLTYINNKLGLQAGDDIVKITVNILKDIFRSSDKVVRLEGNKFMVILLDCLPAAKNTLIKKLENRLFIFNKLNKKNYFIELNILYVEYKGEENEIFVNNSINRLALNKKNTSVKDSVMQEEILSGLNNNEFKTFFQPKIFSKDKKVHFEALVRWKHPKKGMIPPSVFIPVSERSFLIHKITELVLKDSLKAAKKLDTCISVNISPLFFEKESFVRDIKSILADSETRNLIVLEITERSAMTHSLSTVEKMNKLIDLGIKFSIDDFGTGYSSLSYLEKFPISELKIDRSFIANVEKSSINSLIISFSVKVGELSGFEVIAEGVETKEEIEKLLSLGCYNFQGYYFDKAQPLELILKNYSKDKYLNKLELINTEKSD